MIRSFHELTASVAGDPPVTIAVAAAHDDDVLKAVDLAWRSGVINAVLIGDAAKIKSIAGVFGLDLSSHEVLDIPDAGEACRAAVDLIRCAKAQIPMKGFVDTSVFLKAVLNREKGLSSGRLISHVALYEVPGYDRFFLLTDSAINIAPTLAEKADIIRNAVDVARALGHTLPKVAALCAVEKVNVKMPATLDALALTRMNEAGELSGCIVKGPLALDNAISPGAASRKGIEHPVAGAADILLAPDIEAGNLLNKAIEYFSCADKAGVIMGVKTPVILTSRVSSDQTKMHSILLALAVARHCTEAKRP